MIALWPSSLLLPFPLQKSSKLTVCHFGKMQKLCQIVSQCHRMLRKKQSVIVSLIYGFEISLARTLYLREFVCCVYVPGLLLEGQGHTETCVGVLGESIGFTDIFIIV